MELNSLTAISPIDGRYRTQLASLAKYFSEYALIHYRVKVEIEYFLFLHEKKIFSLPKNFPISQLKSISGNFSISDANLIKETEKVTNHDVKAVEYFIKDKLKALHGNEYTEWVHFGLTSQDINNTAIPLLWKDAITELFIPLLSNTNALLKSLATDWNNIPMLARTHGQPASPTILGKEIMVFAERIEGQIALFNYIPYSAKFGGATGNFNAHKVAFPNIDWEQFGNEFVNSKLGLHRTKYTTQIEPYDNLAAQFDCLKRINTIFIDLCRDIWQYISMDYFKQKVKSGEVGSSAMPHKVNPIDFENAEGNLGIANAIYEHMSTKLPVSRLQRDLTDSTVLRNIGVPFAHSYLALLSINKGLKKLILNPVQINSDLENNWAVVAEAIQTILRRENFPNPYEALKDLTRGKSSITKYDFLFFIDNLNINDSLKNELKAISPQNYTGVKFI